MPCWTASSKLFDDRALSSVTRATVMQPSYDLCSKVHPTPPRATARRPGRPRTMGGQRCSYPKGYTLAVDPPHGAATVGEEKPRSHRHAASLLHPPAA